MTMLFIGGMAMIRERASGGCAAAPARAPTAAADSRCGRGKPFAASCARAAVARPGGNCA